MPGTLHPNPGAQDRDRLAFSGENPQVAGGSAQGSGVVGAANAFGEEEDDVHEELNGGFFGNEGFEDGVAQGDEAYGLDCDGGGAAGLVATRVAMTRSPSRTSTFPPMTT